MGDYVVDPYPYTKFHHDTITLFRPPPKYAKMHIKWLGYSFFVLLSAYSQYPCTDFTLNTSNDVSKTQFYISTQLSPKNGNVGPIIDGTLKIRLK